MAYKRYDGKRDKVLEYASEHLEASGREIARALQIGINTVCKIMRELVESGELAPRQVHTVKMTPEMEATLQRLYEEGRLTVSAFRRECRLGQKTGTRLMEEFVQKIGTVDVRIYAKKATTRFYDQIVEFAAEHPTFTAREILNELKIPISFSSVRKLLTKARKSGDLQKFYRGQNGGGRQRIELSVEDREKLDKLVENGVALTRAVVSEALGYTRHIAARILRDYEIEKGIRVENLRESVLEQKMREENDRLERECVLREAWYVAEVCGAGFPGIKLNAEAWSRYLDLYEFKKAHYSRYEVER